MRTSQLTLRDLLLAIALLCAWCAIARANATRSIELADFLWHGVVDCPNVFLSPGWWGGCSYLALGYALVQSVRRKRAELAWTGVCLGWALGTLDMTTDVFH